MLKIPIRMNVLTVLLMCLAFQTVCAVDYYVAKTGSDSNPGTEASPWLTIQKAANTAIAGSTVNIKAGTYNERVNIKVAGNAAEGFITFQNYGADVVILDGSGLNVSGSSAMLNINSKSYLRIKGLEICNFRTSAKGATPAGITISGTAGNIELRNNYIHHIANTAAISAGEDGRNAHGLAVYGTSGTTPISNLVIDGNEIANCTLGSSESMTVNGNVDGFQITNNVIHDNDNIGIDCAGFYDVSPSDDQARNGLVQGNTVYNITSYSNPSYGTNVRAAGGIYVDGGRDIIVERNVVHHSDIGIEAASEQGGKTTTGVTVRSNLIYNCYLTGLAFGGYSTSVGSTANCSFLNNTFIQNDTTNSWTGDILVQQAHDNVVKNNIVYTTSQNVPVTNPFDITSAYNNKFDYNLYFTPGGADATSWNWNNKDYWDFAEFMNGSGQDAHSIFANPLFVNLSTVDAHLQNASPAIDAGDPSYVPAADEKDFFGNNRLSDVRVDIGAFENNIQITTDTTSLVINEGSTNTFHVKLTARPTTSKTVKVTRFSGDSDITVSSGSSLIFTSSNWNSYQTVTIAAAEDADTLNGSAVIRCSSPGMADKDVSATNMDNDTTLTVNSDGNGTTTPSGEIIVTKDTAKSVSASANTGYHFANWTVSIGSATFANANSANTSAAISAPATICANFAINQYTLTYNAGTNGSVSGTIHQIVNHGANGAEVTAAPNAGYHFEKWSDDVTTASRTDTNVTGNKSVTAIFAINTYTVTFVEGTNGTIAGTKSQTLNQGANCTQVTAVPVVNYHFTGWTGDYVGVDNPFTLTNVTSAKTITANFARNTATLTVNKSGNGTAGFTGTNPLNTATAIPITAIADENNHFLNWTYSASATIANANSAATTVTLNSGHGSAATVTANFASGKVVATVTIGALNQTYTGTPRPVTVTTIPAGLNVVTTYIGSLYSSSTAPTDVGTYTVVASANDPSTAGMKTGTLTIAKGVQAINFSAFPANLVYGADDYQLSATASSNLSVSYASSNPAVATIVNDAIHIVGVGTATITATQTGNTNWNAATALAKALTVGKKSQTIDFAAFDAHAMGDADIAPGVTATSGLPVTYSSANSAVATILNGKIHIVGKGTAVITATQAGNTNWSAAPQISQTLNVSVGNQIITFPSLPAKGYGDADFAPATASSGSPITYTSSNPAVATVVYGKIHITGIGSTDITAKQVGNANWNAAGDVTRTLTVGQGTPVITWANPAPIVFGAALSSTQLNATANMSGKFEYSPVAGIKPTVGALTLNVTFTPTDTRYAVVQKSVSLTVNKATATVNITGLSQTYTGTSRPVTATTVPAGLKVNIAYNSSPDAPTNAGTYPVTATVDEINYDGTKNGTLVVAKANQTIAFTAPPTDLIYGDADYPFSATASSGIPVTYASGNTAVATILNGAIHIVGAGTTSITASQTGNANWNAAPTVSKTVAIARKSQTIDFAAFNGKIMGDADFSPNATATSGLPVTYSSTNSAVATILNGKIHLVGKGSAVITATQAGNTNWNAAPQISQTLNVSMGNQEISFPALTAKGYGDADFAPGATASSGLPVICTSSNPAVATIVNGKIHIIGIGSADITAKQAGNINWNAATDVTKTLTVGQGTPVITWANPSPIVFGTALSSTQLNATANVPGKFEYSPLAGIKLPVGVQTLNVTFTPTDTIHYISVQKPVSLTVNKAAASITLAGLSQVYDSQPQIVTATTVPAGLKVNITYNSSADAPTNAGSYAVSTTVDDGNYAGTKNGTLVISKANQTITFPALPTMHIGDDDYISAANASSGLPVTYLSSAPTVATVVKGAIHLTGTGTATITASQSGDSNWNAASTVQKTLTVSNEDQNIKDFYAVMKGYGLAHDTNGLLSLFAPEYVHQGLDVNELNTNLELKDFIEHIQTVTYSISSIKITGIDALVSGQVTVTFNDGRASHTWNEPDTSGNSSGFGWLRMTQGGWRVIGNQVRALVTVETGHNTTPGDDLSIGPYFLRMHAESSLKMTSVSVSGPSIVTTALQPDPSMGGFTEFVGKFTSSRPTVGSAYAFTVEFEDGSQETYQDTVKSWVTAGPVVSVAPDAVTAIIHWTDVSSVVPNAESYWVRVDEGINLGTDLTSVKIWQSADLPITQTSIAFNADGTATGTLVSGHSYTAGVFIFNRSGDYAYQRIEFTMP